VAFSADSVQKQKQVSRAVVEAAGLCVKSAFEELETLRKTA
jgi:hypothetical protein